MSRPLFETLPKAVCAAIRHGNSFDEINASEWSKTYNCSEADVETAWTKALARIASNAIDETREGK
jgi:hypothetical protein